MEKEGKCALVRILTRFLEFRSPATGKQIEQDESKTGESFEEIVEVASKEEVIADAARILKFLKACGKEKKNSALDCVVIEALKAPFFP